jgi:MFS family permease
MNSNQRTGSSGWICAAVVVIATFGYSLLETMLAPALPIIQRELHASPGQLGMVFTGLLLSGAVSTPIIGRLADLYDKRWVLFWTLLVVCAGIVVAALASTIDVLAFGQIMQGVGLGLVPLSIGLINDVLPPDRRGLGNGLVIASATLSTAVGLVTAGPIVAAFNFRWIYWLPLSVVALCTLTILVVNCTTRAVKAPPRKGKIDWLGAVLLACSLVALLLGIKGGPKTGWDSVHVLSLIALAIIGLAVWTLVERRVRSPILDVSLLAKREIALTGVFAFGVGFASVMSYVLVPIFVAAAPSTGIGFSASVAQTGFFLLPLGLAGTVAAPIVSKIERMAGLRTVMILSGVILTAGVWMLGYFHQHPWQVVVAMTCVGIAIGFGLTVAMNAVVQTVPAERAASVSGLVFVVRNVGGTLGVQLGVSLLANATNVITEVTAPSGYEAAFTCAIIVALVATMAAVMFPTRHISHQSNATAANRS